MSPAVAFLGHWVLAVIDLEVLLTIRLDYLLDAMTPRNS